MARHVAKNVVASGLADVCRLQVSYTIGKAEPLSIFVDTSASMGYNIYPYVKVTDKPETSVDAPPYENGNDALMVHKEIITKIVKGIDEGNKHYDGLADVFADKASYVLGTAHPVTVEGKNLSPKIGYPPKSEAEFVKWLEETSYPYVTVGGMPTYINNSLNDAVEAYYGGEFAGLIYIIITDADDIPDADDTSLAEDQAKTIDMVNDMNLKIPLHFFYIRKSPLPAYDPKYIFYKQYHDPVNSHWRGVWEQGTVATIKDKLKNIIGKITESAEMGEVAF